MLIFQDETTKEAYFYYNRVTGTLIDSKNVDSVVDDGTGSVTVVWKSGYFTKIPILSGMAQKASGRGFMVGMTNGVTPTKDGCKMTVTNDVGTAVSSAFILVHAVGGN